MATSSCKVFELAFLRWGLEGLILNFGAGDLLGLGDKANLNSPLCQLSEGVLVEFAISQYAEQTLPQMCEGHFAGQVLLKGGTEHHELIDQIAHLQAWVVVFGCLPADPGEFVL